MRNIDIHFYIQVWGLRFKLKGLHIRNFRFQNSIMYGFILKFLVLLFQYRFALGGTVRKKCLVRAYKTEEFHLSHKFHEQKQEISMEHCRCEFLVTLP